MEKKVQVGVSNEVSSTVADGDVTPQAASISKQELSGEIFSDEPTKKFGGHAAKNVTVFKSPDEMFSVGVFEMTVDEEANSSLRYDNFPKHEFMYFLEGKMTFIDDAGLVTEAGPGEALIIPKGWSGTRTTTSIRKISVMFNENPGAQ